MRKHKKALSCTHIDWISFDGMKYNSNSGCPFGLLSQFNHFILLFQINYMFSLSEIAAMTKQ